MEKIIKKEGKDIKKTEKNPQPIYHAGGVIERK